MKFTHFCSVSLICITTQCFAAEEYSKADQFTIATDDLSVVIRPEAAFTIGRIDFRDILIGKPNGNYGMVVAHEGTQFIGSGHTEGGNEVVHQVLLEIDGETLNDLPLGQKIPVQEATLKKTAQLGEDVEIECITKFSDNTIFASHIMHIKNDTHLSNVYPHMFIWPETTSEYIAGLLNGQIREGEFDNMGWEVEEDVRWMAAYEPNYGIAILSIFPADFPKADENTRKHTYWDHEAYHKQYFIFASRRDFSAGETYQFDVELRFLEADPAQWKDKVKEEVRKQNIPVP